MNEHPNAATGLRVLEAFSTGDVETLREIWSQDVVGHLSTNPYAGTYRGTDDLLQMLANYQELSGNTLRVEPEAALADDNYVMLFFRTRGERPPRRLDNRYVAAAKVGDDGKWKEFWLIPDDQNASDEFFAPSTG